jgi:hypothetical protein
MTRRRPDRLRAEAPQPSDQLAETLRGWLRQAVADGQRIEPADPAGLAEFLRQLGLGRPELAATAPVVTWLIAELLVLEAVNPAAAGDSVKNERQDFNVN